MINFWHRIRTDSTNKISVKMFKLIKHLYDENTFRSKWCNKINDILNNTGLSFLWNFDGVNSNQLKKIIKQQQLDSFSQNWNSAAYENSLCTNYRIYKTQFGFEPYLTLLDSDLRIALAKYRCGSHNLPISIEIYKPIDERNLCPLCHDDHGDEYHYIMTCTAFDKTRARFLDAKFRMKPNTIKFRELFSSPDKVVLVKLCKFIKIILHIFRE